MTQHEYVFVALSIILGLAITRLLHTVSMLIRAHNVVTFHWSSALWALCVMTYSLQFWWVGWGLRGIEEWTFVDFAILTAGSIFLYGAAEMALPVPGSDRTLNFLEHSQGLGRLSALSLVLYFMVGPYVNISLFKSPVVPSLTVPAIGMIVLALMVTLPRGFLWYSLIFGGYTGFIVAITA
jgi:hypothetical protein